MKTFNNLFHLSSSVEIIVPSTTNVDVDGCEKSLRKAYKRLKLTICLATCLLLLASCTQNHTKSDNDSLFYNSVYAQKFRTNVVKNHSVKCKETRHENCIVFYDRNLKTVQIKDIKR